MLTKNKTLTLVYKLLVKGKPSEQVARHTNRFPSQAENIERLSKDIVKSTNNVKQLIQILVSIVQNINLENYKQVSDSYINVNAYASLVAEHLIVGKMEVIRQFRSNFWQ
jgi:hypothetical protein